MSGPIVLGYDASESAQGALAEATTLAKELGAEVVVVFAYYISPLGGGDVRDYKSALESMGAEAVQEAVGRLEAAGVAVSSRLVSGKAADAIIDVAREVSARLVVVGSAGEGVIKGAVLGSVVLRLVQTCPVPMLVVPRA